MSGADVDAITALLHEYTYRLDAGDLDGVVALFAHAVVRSTRHDRVLEGAAIRSIYEPVILYDDGTPRTLHQLTNVTVEMDAARGTARARSYFTVLQAGPDGLRPILAGEYHDRFDRAGGTWRFRERIFDPKLFGDLSRHMRRPVPPGAEAS